MRAFDTVTAKESGQCRAGLRHFSSEAPLQFRSKRRAGDAAGLFLRTDRSGDLADATVAGHDFVPFPTLEGWKNRNSIPCSLGQCLVQRAHC